MSEQPTQDSCGDGGMSAPLTGEISAALRVLGAYLAEWLERRPPEQQEVLANALRRGCRLCTRLYAGDAELHVCLVQPDGLVRRLGVATFDTVPPNERH